MRARVINSKEYSTLGATLTMRFLLLSACLAVTRAENVAMTSSGTAVFTSEGRLLSATPDRDPVQAQGEVDNFSDVAIDPANVVAPGASSLAYPPPPLLDVATAADTCPPK